MCNEKGSQGKKRRQRVNTTTLSFEFKELKQNTMYEVKLAGLTKVKGFLRNGAISPTWNITTKPGNNAWLSFYCGKTNRQTDNLETLIYEHTKSYLFKKKSHIRFYHGPLYWLKQ